MKPCKICGISQELENFEPARRYADGRDTRCRSCRKEEHKARKIRRETALKDGSLHEGVTCPICKTTTVMSQKISPTRQAIVDHDHNTGETRGVICSLCNSGLGKLGDTLENITNAYNYMLKHYKEPT